MTARVLGVKVTRGRRLAFFIAIDASLVAASVVIAFLLRFDLAVPVEHRDALVAVGFGSPAVVIVILAVLRIYRTAWSFIGLRDILRIGASVILAAILFEAIAVARLGPVELPRSIPLIQAPIALLLLAAFRLVKRVQRMISSGVAHGVPTLIVGAGAAGAQLLKSVQEAERPGPHGIIGFIDDDPLATKTLIHGVPVLGPVARLDQIIAKHEVRAVIIGVEEPTGALVREVVQRAQEAGVTEVRVIPPANELVEGRYTVETTRRVGLEDLLGRETIDIDVGSVRHLIERRRVLVTGGAGTIGSELCRQVSRLGPSELLILDVDETRLHDLHLELAAAQAAIRITPVLLDVRDGPGIERLFARGRVDVVFHAAAYKHVPMMEEWPLAGLDVNVLGTANLARIAESAGCAQFVLISTDKAVEPSSAMGATKRLAEIVLFGTAPPHHHMIRSAVRFGNVIGSRGSVVTIFEKQLERGEPLTVTHPEMERFFMMTSEAVSLVMQAAALGQGGEVFVLDMGKPVRILELARDFLRLHGLTPDVDVKIAITGLRPGEKLSEILHYPEETMRSTKHPRILHARASESRSASALVEEARAIVESRDQERARAFLASRFPTLMATTVRLR